MATAPATEYTSSLTLAQLQALEQAIYADVLKRRTRASYSIQGQQFTFSSLADARQFLEWIRDEISARSPGGGFSLAQFGAL